MSDNLVGLPCRVQSRRRSLKVRIDADAADQRRAFFFRALDEVNRQPDDLVAVEFEFPDGEVAGDLVAAAAVAVEVQAGGFLAEGEALGAAVFADGQELPDRRADVQGPA